MAFSTIGVGTADNDRTGDTLRAAFQKINANFALAAEMTELLAAANTWSAANIFSANGAASTPPLKLTGTWFTGGSTTTTKPQYLIEPAGTTSTLWHTSGTGLGVNAPNSFAGNLADFQVNGVPKFQVLSTGTLAVYNTFTDYSNYERSFFRYSSNILQFGHEAAGTGTGTRDIEWWGNGSLRLRYGGSTNRFTAFCDIYTQGSSVLISSTGGIGYTTGAGGAVTQATSRTTGVTLNKSAGAITLFTAAGSATATSFTVTNSVVAATDTINLNVKSSTTNKYLAFVSAVAAGSFEITFYTTGGTTSDAPVFNFAVIKAAAS